MLIIKFPRAHPFIGWSYPFPYKLHLRGGSPQAIISIYVFRYCCGIVQYAVLGIVITGLIKISSYFFKDS